MIIHASPNPKLVEFETKLKNSHIGVTNIDELIESCLSGTLVILPTHSWEQLCVWEETLKKIEDAFNLKFFNHRFLHRSQKLSSEYEDEDGEEEKNVHFQSFGTTDSGADSGSCSSDTNSKPKLRNFSKIVVKNKAGGERGVKKSRTMKKEEETNDAEREEDEEEEGTKPSQGALELQREDLDSTGVRKGEEGARNFKKQHHEYRKSPVEGNATDKYLSLNNKPKKKKKQSDNPLDIENIQLIENLRTSWDRLSSGGSGVFGQENGQWTPKHTFHDIEKKGDERKHKVKDIPSFQKALLFFVKEKKANEGGGEEEEGEDPEKMWEMLSDDEKKIYYDMAEKELSDRNVKPSQNLSSNEISEEKTPRTEEASSPTLTLSHTPVLLHPPPPSWALDQPGSRKIPPSAKMKMGKLDIRNMSAYHPPKKKKKKILTDNVVHSPLSKSSESSPKLAPPQGRARFFSGSGSEEDPNSNPTPTEKGVPPIMKFTRKQKLLSGSASSDEDKK